MQIDKDWGLVTGRGELLLLQKLEREEHESNHLSHGKLSKVQTDRKAVKDGHRDALA